ncbi:hypothetical protein GSbR_26000 [Geobacter sp. SVR]|nr:hypothetical protein GSVR_35070 [Geobacter sp. SVR]GCF86000.1 hypothetical protein GSbR_26000 [Geobacter sp. SVR]
MQMRLLVRHYLHTEPAQELEELMEQYVEALWIEDRQATLLTNAVAKAFGGK